MIPRYYSIKDLVQPKKVLVIYGPRRVGKTTLLQNFLATTDLKYRRESGDNIRAQQALGSQDFPTILEYVEGLELLAIDEAQMIPNIGQGLKIIVDERPDMRCIATGSSSFDLASSVGEPLTGRKQTITLYPISQLELRQQHSVHELKQLLPDFLVYGSYPEVLTAQTKQEKKNVLEELVNSYIFKDILQFEQVKGAGVLLDLLALLAFQIGNEVSFHELAVQLGIDTKTVERYIDLFEKSFLITRLRPMSRNMRKNVRKKQKYYFIDLGIRNALIARLTPVEQRDDVGQLWENFVVIERLKKRAYKGILANPYFWRTYSGKEIDLIEERDGGYFAFECKWSKTSQVRLPQEWLDVYPNTTPTVITPENYLEFVA